MKTVTPLLYASHYIGRPLGPMLKVKLPPVRKLFSLSVLRIKSELRIKQYLRFYTAIFTVMGVAVAVSLMILNTL